MTSIPRYRLQNNMVWTAISFGIGMCTFLLIVEASPILAVVSFCFTSLVIQHYQPEFALHIYEPYDYQQTN
jgi:hypothetical protein